jgi:hypothetical protein
MWASTARTAAIAALRADALLAQGDLEGAYAYRSIVRGINELLETPSGAAKLPTPLLSRAWR